MPHRQKARKCLGCQGANVFAVRAGLRIYIQCPDAECFEKHYGKQ